MTWILDIELFCVRSTVSALNQESGAVHSVPASAV
jgi:hypothetical protein